MSTSRQPTDRATAQASTPAISRPYVSLVDDASIFPPGNAPLPRAVSAHRAHQQAAYADLLGPFVISDNALPELIALRPIETLGVAVVVTGGAGALEPAVRWASRSAELELRSVEIALRGEADLAQNARRVVTAADQLVNNGDLDEDVPLSVEPPRLFGRPPTPSWHAALDELAASELRLKFRTGGVNTEDFPSASELATCIESALDRELSFKCTAGLHHAVRRREQHTGFEQHGFLNVLLATRASLDGVAPDDVANLLDETDATVVKNLLSEAGEDKLVSARRWFTSFGSCSVLDPVQDLVALGLLPGLPPEAA